MGSGAKEGVGKFEGEIKILAGTDWLMHPSGWISRIRNRYQMCPAKLILNHITMDIKEIQEKKATLEATIRDMIADFEDETGVKVYSIDYGREHVQASEHNYATIRLLSITVTI